MSSNLKARGLVLRAGEKNLRDNVPIRFNDWASVGGSKKDPDLMYSKVNTIKFSVLTHNHGVGLKSIGTKDCSIGTKSSLKLDRIEDNPKAVIEVWQSILNELLPAMIDVDPITGVELFEAHLTGAAAKEFQQIVYKVTEKLYDSYIDVEFNMRICRFTDVDKTNAELSQEQRDQLTDDDQKIRGNELAKWWARNTVRKNVRGKLSGIRNYDFQFPPEAFPSPPMRPSKGKFLNWNVTGVNALNANAWLRQHNHGWEFGERYFNMIIEAVQNLAFKQYGKHAGQTQIDYLTEDLKMDPSHSVKNFFRILTCHSEAQPFYPTMSMNTEVGSPFTDDRKIQIVWNSGAELFKKQLTTLGITRREDFKSQFETCQEKFLIAEQHRTADEAKAVKPAKTPSTNGDKKQGGGDRNKSKRYTGKCNFCQKAGHKASDCFSNPDSVNFKAGSSKTGGEPATKKRKAYDPNWKTNPKFQEWKEKKQYDAYCADTGEDGYDEE